MNLFQTSTTIVSIVTLTTASLSSFAVAQSSLVSPSDPTAQQCQTTIANKIKQSYGGVEKVIWDSSTTTQYFISNAETGIKGNGQFLQSGGWKNFTYNCTVNIRNGTVTNATYTLVTGNGTQTGGPAPLDDPSARQCQTTIANKIKQSYAGVEKVTYSTDTTTKYFISNAETGIKGNGQFLQGGGWKNFTYNCTVNIRNGTVTNATYILTR